MADRWRRVPALGLGGAALALALALPAGALALKPAASGSVSLAFDGCAAHVIADWANQPGRYKAYQLRIINDVNGTMYSAGEGSARSGHVDTVAQIPAGTTKNFTVWLWFLDRDGVVVTGYGSNTVAAACS